MATHSNILAWRILWTENPGKLQSIETQRVGHNQSEHARTGCPPILLNTWHIAALFNWTHSSGMNNRILYYSLNFNFPDDWCAYWPFIYILWWRIISIFWIHAYTCTTNIFSNSWACFFISLMSFGEQRFLIFMKSNLSISFFNGLLLVYS